ncbi:terminase TerL endonuclease subunit [Nitratireductor sp. StC3]|uniref:terminase large subunit n=1 Tax=Nitratireductor sp. StC3 TaxID=2126741 RepID=UPI000D0DB3DC|nr:terminase TerL endonuclease subunit [Nitratireductor sp. StC3]PSM16114.1 terminase [Nitratireductor sp. StC3]
MPIVIRKKPKNPFPEIPDPLGYGQRAVDFIRSLKHPLSTRPDNAFPLDPWAEKIIRQIYGPRHPDGSRVVKTAVLLVPRGNRKTTLTGAITLLHAKGPERRPGAQLVSVAVDKKQAKGVFKEVAGMIDGDYAFAPNIGNSAKTVDEARGAKIRDYVSKIMFPGGIEYEALASDAGTAQGRTPSLIIADEIHAWLKRDPRELWGAMRAGAAKVANSLTVITTTAGAGQENLAFDVIDYARKVARGEIHDPATLPILFEAPRDADWKDETVWHAVNPGLKHGYPDLEGLRQMAREAEHKPSERSIFQRYHLNIWQDHSSDPFVDMAVYDQGAKSFDLSDLEREPCWLAVDLSSNSDLTVIIAAWQDGEDGYIVHPWFFCPRDNLHRKADRDGVPYPLWAEEGYIEPTPGNVVDFRAVEDTIRDLCERFDVREIAFDPHLARNMMNTLREDGYPAIEMRQGWVTMAPAIKELERAIVAGRFTHGGHPVLRWNFDNIAVETDKAGNKAFHKGKSRDRIDGAVAAAMAVARASTGEGGGRSFYENDDWADYAVINC